MIFNSSNLQKKITIVLFMSIVIFHFVLGLLKLVCPNGHRLELCDSSKRQVMTVRGYQVVGIICDICKKHIRYYTWCCNCSTRGFDICEACADRQQWKYSPSNCTKTNSKKKFRNILLIRTYAINKHLFMD